ncbi:peptide ABC transporter ATP-binding protein [Vibrio sp. UCD-FRSSP16_10]|uniref:ABC transporter ATP-binding protein n=1 Tax=unclassified Vibrio TaxID=2614977 RepID=UPI000800BF3B|nr:MULTISPECIES: ABC transporter ATP-binding protein [unclassified Vibrio]OBT13368.1 peptide ABC transporter ATP-binding protein [Vibrio sp. UCD-FRSSP16_10]OBT17878.1 peptide ABC transporter ATP-binding protein [Vibrio sp. UCD-FRSSP16_30]
MSDKVVLSLKNVTTTFSTDEGDITALNGVTFDVIAGRTIGIVGESGCGKSITAASIMNLLPQPYGNVTDGEILFEGRDITKLNEAERCAMRGHDISMIFQDPMTALNPVVRVGKQVEEVYELHSDKYTDSASRRQAVLEMFKKVGISEPEKRLDVYPHELSGGMRQRVIIAMALACEPKVLIADEPTTALDVTIQAQILELMKRMQKELGMAIVFITHDLGVVAEICDDVAVMYAGNVVEQGTVYQIFGKPTHPYTQGLLASMPTVSSVPKTQLNTIEGSVPQLKDMPVGCRFVNRCPIAMERCKTIKPQPTTVEPGHLVSCLAVKEVM